MKTIMQKLAAAAFVTAAALGIAQTDGDTKELRAKDIKEQMPEAALHTSAPCLQAKASPDLRVTRYTKIDPGTLVPNLSTLIQQSDEVVLAGTSIFPYRALSPSGERVIEYYDVKVMRSWKGSHQVGETLTFGVPYGGLYCGSTEANHLIEFDTVPPIGTWANIYDGVPHFLFLRKPQGDETELVQTLIPAGGEGLQGVFSIWLSPTSEAARNCNGELPGALEWCDSYMETSLDQVRLPYNPDPLKKKYDGVTVSKFLRIVNDLAAHQGLEEKSTTNR
jgi:hypothetical protein